MRALPIVVATLVLAGVPLPVPAQSVGAPTCLAGSSEWSQIQHQSNNGRETMRLSRSGCDFELRLEGDVELAAASMDVVRLGPGARVRVEEDSRGTDHALEIRPGPDGAPRYAYELNGRSHEFDGAARAWLRSALGELVLMTGFMAEERVAALLREGGVEAVLREMDESRSSHGFARYAGALLERAELGEAELRALVRTSARRVESDHYMAGILESVASHQPLSGGLLDDYIEAVAALDSDHYRAETLRAAIRSDRLTGEQIERVLRSAGAMDSDHYRAEILTGIADRYALEPSFRPAYLEATSGMDSDHYRSRVLSRLLDRPDLSSDEKAAVLRATSMVRSDHYRSELLQQVGRRGLEDASLHRAFFDVAAGLESDHYYRRAIDALLDQRVAPELLAEVLRHGATILESDHYLSELLLDVLRAYPVEGDVRAAFLAGMDTLDSDHYRGRVADALLRAERD